MRHSISPVVLVVVFPDIARLRNLLNSDEQLRPANFCSLQGLGTGWC